MERGLSSGSSCRSAISLSYERISPVFLVCNELWRGEEVILHHSSSADGGDYFAFPSAEGEVVGLDIVVAGLYLLEEAALGAFLVTEDFVGAYVVGEDGKEETVFAVFAEHSAETVEVGAEEGVGFGNGEVTGEVLGGLDLVAPSDIGIVLADVMPAFVVFDDAHGSLVVGQTQNGVLRLGLRLAQKYEGEYQRC